MLAWYDNIPAISWLVLRGKCRTCRTPISPRYVIVEVLTGILFVMAQARFGFTWPLVSALTFLCVLIPLAFIDAEHWILPFELLLPGLGLGIVLQIPLGREAIVASIVGATSGFLVFRLIEYVGFRITKQEAMGAGDKYLVAMIGAFMGWRSLLGLILLASIQGAIVGIVRLRMTGRAGPAVESGDPPGDEMVPRVFSPAIFRANLNWVQRLRLIPFTLFFQDIPDLEIDETTGDDTWIPQANNIPFGPWLALAAVEILLLGPTITTIAQDTALGDTLKTLFG